MKPKRLTKIQVERVLEFLDKGFIISKEIAQALGITKMQVAAVKAWRMMGVY